ncbi:hypothetical protein L1887_05144 [Cichorium endivia]|nr:hypothetical protein L1887_05144 [Cichorium endivia]
MVEGGALSCVWVCSFYVENQPLGLVIVFLIRRVSTNVRPFNSSKRSLKRRIKNRVVNELWIEDRDY